MNKVNGRYYIGRSRNLINRMHDHKRDLNCNIHCNKHLQNAWNKYGGDEFTFVIIKFVDDTSDIIIKEEQFYLDIAKNELDKTYNMIFTALGVARKNDNERNSMIRALILKNDAKSYTFINIKNGDAFIGNRFDFMMAFKLPGFGIRALVKNHRYKSWVLHDNIS